ncbi:hypothetical protein H6785_01490 [Candidatus Nomurabacteria bacterium]|nr:hypothetical protein [Candidatus Kaiserbacteria bacterium]MCB9815241.1 hypothetical protein [Candidatus Nomurabacteria bacterium]
MINLIPPHAKRELRKEYWVRVCSVWLLLSSLSLVIGVFILLPVNVLIGSQVKAYEESASAASKNVVNYENISSELIQASTQAKYIVDEAHLVDFSEYITIFQNLEGESIQISSINISRDTTGVAPILLSGVASDRQALASFRDRIKELEVVSDVDFPVSNLTKDKDISFTITVTFNKEKSV